MEDKTSKRTVSRVERRQQAVGLRKQGLTFQEIGDIMGINRSNSYRLVLGELKRISERTRENAETLITMELMRLDAMLNAVWDKAAMGDVQSVDRVLKVLAARAKLLGLDAPQKLAPTTPDGGNPYDGITEAERNRLLSKLFAEALSERDGIIIVDEDEDEE